MIIGWTNLKFPYLEFSIFGRPTLEFPKIEYSIFWRPALEISYLTNHNLNFQYFGEPYLAFPNQGVVNGPTNTIGHAKCSIAVDCLAI